MNRHLSLLSAHTGSPAPGPARQRRQQRTRTLLKVARESTDDHARRSALHEVIELNMEVARTLARPYVGHGVATDDLFQVAYTALVRAARDFDADRHDVDFLSYVVPTVRGEIRRYFRDVAWTVRPPRRVQDAQAAVSSARQRLRQQVGGEPSTTLIAEETGVDEHTVTEALSATGCFTPSSLDVPLGPDGATSIGDQVASATDEFDLVETRTVLRSAIATLTARDRAIIRMRFYDGLTQREIGECIGVTQMQVSRLLTRILGDLREEIGDAWSIPA